MAGCTSAIYRASLIGVFVVIVEVVVVVLWRSCGHGGVVGVYARDCIVSEVSKELILYVPVLERRKVSVDVYNLEISNWFRCGQVLWRSCAT